MSEESRKSALDELLAPIEWSWSSSIRARQNLVISRREKVRLVCDFLEMDELIRAEKWLETEHHNGLWD